MLANILLITSDVVVYNFGVGSCILEAECDCTYILTSETCTDTCINVNIMYILQHHASTT